jgi:hypothetical protein
LALLSTSIVDAHPEPTVGDQPTPTVGATLPAATGLAPTGFWVSEDGQRIFPAARVRPIRQALDALSAYETQLYRLLSTRASAGAAGQRTVSAGYGQLGRELAIDRQNIKRLLARLQDKGLLDELAPGRANERTPSLYRLPDPTTALQRMHARGRLHCVHSGHGVLFVYPTHPN